MYRTILGDLISYFGTTMEIAVIALPTMVIGMEYGITAMVTSVAVNAAGQQKSGLTSRDSLKSPLSRRLD